jgi:hypothetical protein
MYKYNQVFTFKNKKYRLDNHHVKYRFSENEYEIAKWLSKRINKRITIIPDIEYPLGIKHADYRIGNRYFDLKTVYGNSKQIIYHKIRNQKEQANNFIFYISNKSLLKLSDIRKQINYLFKSTNPDRDWVDIIIIIYKKKTYIYKKPVTPREEVAGITDL